MKRIASTAALLAATFPGPAAAQSPVPSPQPAAQLSSRGSQALPTPLVLTLDEAVDRAIETSNRLAEIVARGDAAGAAADVHHASRRPQVVGQVGFARTNHVDQFGILLPGNQLRVIYPDIPDNYRTRLDLQWPIYTAGRLEALERAARAEAAAFADDLVAARSDLRLEVTRAYWALVTAAESLRVVERSVARVDAHLRDIRNQLAAGFVPPSDVLTVEAQRSRQRMLAVQARFSRDVAEAELGRLVGADPGNPIQAASTLDRPEGAGGAEAAAAEALLEARGQRRERAGLVKRVDAAGERRAAAASGRKPTIAVGGGLDYARPNPRIFPRQAAWREAWDASVNVNWPVFDGGRARAELAEAEAATRAAEARLAEFDSALAVEVRQRLGEIEANRAAIDAAEDAVRAATEANRVVSDRFAAGVATSTDLLDAEVALLQAELDRTQAIANARLAEARLTRALGH